MDSRRHAAGRSAGTLWFNPAGSEENRRHALTRDRVVAEVMKVQLGILTGYQIPETIC
jgi:hypothetical protein